MSRCRYPPALPAVRGLVFSGQGVAVSIAPGLLSGIRFLATALKARQEKGNVSGFIFGSRPRHKKRAG